MSHINYFRKVYNKLNIALNDWSAINVFEGNDKDFYVKHMRINKLNKFDKQNHQIGCTINEIKYKVDNYKFIIYEDNEDNAYSIFRDNNKNEQECLVLIASTDELGRKFIYLQNLSKYQNCVKPEMPKTKGGSLLLKLALEFSNNYLKKKYKATYIQLKDNSFIACKITKTNIQFDNFYMFTHADTWYGKYGFIPYDPTHNKIDVDNLVNYKVNQKLVNIIKLKHTNIKQYIKDAIQKLNIEEKIPSIKLNKMFEKYEDKSIKDFFISFLYESNYEYTCAVFEKIYLKLMRDLDIENLHGCTYYLEIK